MTAQKVTALPSSSHWLTKAAVVFKSTARVCSGVLFAILLGLSLPSLALDRASSLQFVPAAHSANANYRLKPAELSALSALALSSEAQSIKQLLVARYRPAGGAPQMDGVFVHLSAYYAQFAEVRALFEVLSRKPWVLEYAANTHETVMVRSRSQVKSVTVRFDPTMGAQVKFQRRCGQKRAHCFASPADVLLHELLHVKAHSVLFSEVGGAISGMYPYQHEYQTLDQENALYLSMQRIDGRARPIRKDHQGKTVGLSCVTCVH